MSLAAIILGLLIWLSLPHFYRRTVTPKAYFYISLLCKVVGIAFVAGGVLCGFF